MESPCIHFTHPQKSKCLTRPNRMIKTWTLTMRHHHGLYCRPDLNFTRISLTFSLWSRLSPGIAHGIKLSCFPNLLLPETTPHTCLSPRILTLPRNAGQVFYRIPTPHVCLVCPHDKDEVTEFCQEMSLCLLRTSSQKIPGAQMPDFW